MTLRIARALALVLVLGVGQSASAAAPSSVVDRDSMRGKVLVGYQGWFRCPADASGRGWVHWSREANRLTAETLTFEMWPEMSEYRERYTAAGFAHPDGRPAELFSSDSTSTVQLHCEWMRDYGIDGVWLQHFAVDFPTAPGEQHYASRRRIMQYLQQSAAATGRIWALTIDITGAPRERIFELVTAEWTRLVGDRIPEDPRYLRERGLPVLEIFGFYPTTLSAADAIRLLDFFHAPGATRAFVVGGCDWDWRRNPDATWQQAYRQLDAISPWNIGNLTPAPDGTKQATTNYWEADLRACEERGQLWLPVVYPGFGWDNLKRLRPGTSTIARRGGRFLWEQFDALAALGVAGAKVAMFDEVDEATAIFKVTNTPPTGARFLDYEGLPSDWYLRLTGAGARLLRGESPRSRDLPFPP